MVALKLLLGVFGNITAITLFSSPCKVVYGMAKKKSTEEFSAVPFLTVLLNCSFWFIYSILHGGLEAVLIINSIGIALEFIFLTTFCIFAKDRKKFFLYLIPTLAAISVAAGIAHFVEHDLAVKIVGWMTFGFCISMYAGPLAVTKTVITTKSTEFLPVFPSIMSLVNGLAWGAYGLDVSNWVVYIPNGVCGGILGVIQVLLLIIYPNKPKTEAQPLLVDEEDPKNLV
eukprot:TRINITY_DN28822_c0_g1_i1.p1 TRINITY_DN28822_c0_g1~~TRINITY_DN28822_c0_g1_i1.p1  ORF type:complete len:260 (-),score=69.81 TRINITY_DN28822_c0_g1_i1:90-773(-)